ncbi:MAG: sulfate adenylyltransferase subunit CysN [Chitinophagales bacterium]|nr:sulfate adenylyltransferase subunit CysN [Hyphomicrobiales bacterium]
MTALAAAKARPAFETETAPATAQKGLLCFLTCGSVDDGKSTLIGRMLYDAREIYDDQLTTLEADSKKVGTTGGEIDLALLVDGLQAEREQGITIDVAYRYFSTPRRKFIVADTPGHEQYTRNMATGASVSDVAIILADARKGVLTQTRRHSTIVHLLGIRHVVLAVNKMDLAGFSRETFERISEDYAQFAKALGLEDVVAIPVAARSGDNVLNPSDKMPWYQGPTLMSYLEEVEVGADASVAPFRFPVQIVSRPNADFRGFAGTAVSGRIAAGDKIAVLPSGRTSTVSRIVTYDGDVEAARAGDAVTLTLSDEVDVSRGDMIVAAGDRAEIADQFCAKMIWMSEEPALPGRSYLIKLGTQTATASISALKHKIDVDKFEQIAGKQLELNEIGLCNLSTSRPLVFDPYSENRTTGGFILIDKMSNATVGAGLIQFPLRRAANVHWQALDLDKTARGSSLGQKPCCLWFTGLSGSGKSTVANLLEKRLHSLGRHTYILDGDNVRHGLNRDLGFTDADRVENIRRVSEVARLMVDAGLIVMVSFISPFRAERQMVRELFAEGEFIEVFVDTPIEICEARDVKGLYKKARAGQIANFTGISSAYEPPLAPEMRLEGGVEPPEALVERIVAALQKQENRIKVS